METVRGRSADSSYTPSDAETSVVVTGVDIPFGDLMVFFVKAGLAAVPAAIVLGLIGIFVSAVGTGLIAGLLRH